MMANKPETVLYRAPFSLCHMVELVHVKINFTKWNPSLSLLLITPDPSFTSNLSFYPFISTSSHRLSPSLPHLLLLPTLPLLPPFPTLPVPSFPPHLHLLPTLPFLPPFPTLPAPSFPPHLHLLPTLPLLPPFPTLPAPSFTPHLHLLHVLILGKQFQTISHLVAII